MTFGAGGAVFGRRQGQSTVDGHGQALGAPVGFTCDAKKRSDDTEGDGGPLQGGTEGVGTVLFVLACSAPHEMILCQWGRHGGGRSGSWLSLGGSSNGARKTTRSGPEVMTATKVRRWQGEQRRWGTPEDRVRARGQDFAPGRRGRGCARSGSFCLGSSGRW